MRIEKCPIFTTVENKCVVSDAVNLKVWRRLHEWLNIARSQKAALSTSHRLSRCQVVPELKFFSFVRVRFFVLLELKLLCFVKL